MSHVAGGVSTNSDVAPVLKPLTKIINARRPASGNNRVAEHAQTLGVVFASGLYHTIFDRRFLWPFETLSERYVPRVFVPSLPSQAVPSEPCVMSTNGVCRQHNPIKIIRELRIPDHQSLLHLMMQTL